MDITTFEAELQTIHKDFSIKKSKVAGLARVCFQGSELFSIPDTEIYDNRNEQYGFEHPNGSLVPHRTRIEALGMAREIAERMLKDSDYKDAMTGQGAYSDKELSIGQFQDTIKVDLKPLDESSEAIKPLIE